MQSGDKNAFAFSADVYLCDDSVVKTFAKSFFFSFKNLFQKKKE
jgi:hypothetical protein